MTLKSALVGICLLVAFSNSASAGCILEGELEASPIVVEICFRGQCDITRVSGGCGNHFSSFTSYENGWVDWSVATSSGWIGGVTTPNGNSLSGAEMYFLECREIEGEGCDFTDPKEVTKKEQFVAVDLNNIKAFYEVAGSEELKKTQTFLGEQLNYSVTANGDWGDETEFAFTLLLLEYKSVQKTVATPFETRQLLEWAEGIYPNCRFKTFRLDLCMKG